MPEPTNGEIARQLDYVAQDLRGDLGDIKGEIAKLLPREVYDAHQAVIQEQLRALRDRITTLETRGRWLWGVVAMPIIAVILSWFLTVWSVRP